MCYVARQHAVRLSRSLHVLALLLAEHDTRRQFEQQPIRTKTINKQARRPVIVVVDGDRDDRERPVHSFCPVLVMAWMRPHNIGRVLKLGEHRRILV